MRLWYLRRAIPWRELAGCGTVAVVLTAAVHRWPTTGDLLLPYALAACAAAAGFVMDEPAAAVVTVTARGDVWRVLARFGSLVLPLLLWTVIVLGLPDQAATQPRELALAGVTACLLAGGSAAALARSGLERPGSSLAAALVGVTTLPFVLGGFFGWDPVFPVHASPSWVTDFWLGVGLAAVGSAAIGLRRTP